MRNTRFVFSNRADNQAVPEFFPGFVPPGQLTFPATGSGRFTPDIQVIGVLNVLTPAKSQSRAKVELIAKGHKAFVGAWAVFGGPGSEDAPQRTLIQVSKVLGGTQQQQQKLAAMVKAHLEAERIENVSVGVIELEVDPLDPHYGGDSAGLPPANGHRLLISGKVVSDGNSDRVVLNYTNTGVSVAHAMIAATPEVGLDVGDPSLADPAALLPLLHNVAASVLTHRGQNAQAIFLLETRLRLGGWGGPGRWHARDQLAMRWAQAGQTRQALWSVREDVALGESNEDPDAVINAVGTLMPLLEDLGLMESSLDEAERFYTQRKAIGPGPYTMHAWRSFIEALFKVNRHEDAERELAEFQNACEPVFEELTGLATRNEPRLWAGASCVGDMFYALLTFYWHSKDEGRRADYLSRAEELAHLLGQPQMASVRTVQGLEALGRKDLDGAQIAFMEARRLHAAQEYLPGVARVDALTFNLYLTKEDRQSAYETAMNAADVYARLGDVHELVAVYRSLPRLYVNVPPGDQSFAAYARAADDTMAEALRLQLAAGELGNAAEVFFVSGRFRMGSNPGQATQLLQLGRDLALRATRFDVVALTHLFLAMTAQARGDGAAFQSNMEEAKEFARIAGDPALLQTITRIEEGTEPTPRDTL